VPALETKENMTQAVSPTRPNSATASPANLQGSRIPMSQVNVPVFVAVAFGVMALGFLVGGVTGNGLFILEMAGLPLVGIFLFAAFMSSTDPTYPAGGAGSAALPVVALILACLGSVLGIALGHASRHLIASRGGEGEKIALAALIVGYSSFAIEVIVGFWFLTFLHSLG
jgi:hypothetical protein